MADPLNQASTESHNAPAPDLDHQPPPPSTIATIPEMDEGDLEPEGAESQNNEGEDGRDDEENPPSIGDGDAAIAMQDDDDNAQPQGRCPALVAWFKSNAFLIYCSQFFSAWGDRMWTFAVALYLVEIEDNSLRLTAVFGFALTISVLLFGTLVGQWVDRTPRLSATRQSLVIQNSGVIINAVCLLILLHFKTEILPVGNGSLFFFCQVVIIVLGVIANLASVAEKICIQKDWVVVLAGGNKERLAEMNATVRRIDLTVNILAPILVGQIMSFASMTVAGIFIAGWNLCSLILEYYLLLRVYKKVPRLAIKLHKDETETATAAEPAGQTTEPEAATEPNEEAEIKPSAENPDAEPQADAQVADEDEPPMEHSTAGDARGTDEHAEPDYKSGGPKNTAKGWSRLEEDTPDDQQPADTEVQVTQPSPRPTILRRVANWFISYYHGWLTYKSYPVYMAGLALAFLYMTVMGFDSITTGYGYSMGISEALLGVIRGLGSIAGIVGTFVYQRMRQKIGATRTGLYALSEEILCLLLCVFSVWAAGSPFDPYYYFSGQSNSPTAGPTIGNDTGNFSAVTPNVTMDHTPLITPQGRDDPKSYLSPILFFAGMVTSRVGLWMFDLVTTQLIQENVQENQRGVFNGVQRSLECSMDMLHFILVIILPAPETFGYLIVISFFFICTGAVLYCVFSFRDRGHLFHTEKLTQCLHQNGEAGRMMRFHNETENDSEA
ncbi:solute carrier family 40 member 1-like [Patiria miniata]|uniref:Solute carrier family 40 protein n=1 Tax=Patiria miniata TaxID=46514 RepID=A0A913YZ10_PATMI|nr:solute carrier family 40 member 1-like [Patiria miniata]